MAAADSVPATVILAPAEISTVTRFLKAEKLDCRHLKKTSAGDRAGWVRVGEIAVHPLI
jgi:hypothetical protein